MDFLVSATPPIAKALGVGKSTAGSLWEPQFTYIGFAEVNLKIVSGRFGYFRLSVTMDIYIHVLPGMQEEATLAVERLLHRPAPSEV